MTPSSPSDLIERPTGFVAATDRPRKRKAEATTAEKPLSPHPTRYSDEGLMAIGKAAYQHLPPATLLWILLLAQAESTDCRKSAPTQLVLN